MDTNAKQPGNTDRRKVIRNVPYAHTGTRDLLLDLYLDENAPAPQPLLIYIHGGAWRTGSKEEVDARLDLLPAGYALASIQYRLSHEAIFPAQIRDCKAAVRWLRAHAREYHLDPQRFAAWGPSAGGHLVALLGTAANQRGWDAPGAHLDQSSAIQAVVDWFGPSDFSRMNDTPGAADHFAPDSPESQLIGAPVLDNPELVAAASPISYIQPGTPPFLIVHGTEDDVVIPSQSQLLHAALTREGVDSTLVLVPGAGHGFAREQYEQVWATTRAFLMEKIGHA